MPAGEADFVRHQYVVLETSNRDELVVELPEGLASPQPAAAGVADPGRASGHQRSCTRPISFSPAPPGRSWASICKSHEDVETAGARIDLAQTTIVVDANGAYRAKVELSLDNSSEQFLDVELPDGATLWTVHVAGEPVKPGQVPGATNARHVLLPVRKTAKGDLNYRVVLEVWRQAARTFASCPTCSSPWSAT